MDGTRTTLFPSNYPANSVPMGNRYVGTEGSSTGDFRGVIDDLTIQNKKLKRKLKKYEQMHDAHLQDDKLFEVRFHGLPPAKKVELEEMLRKFAVGMSSQSATATPLQAQPQQVLPAALSKMRSFADSAYISASGLEGTTSVQSSSDSHKKTSGLSAANFRQRSVQSYLHGMSNGLSAHHPVAMTEKAKKKLIVRRLEQVFAGKLATDGAHHHPQQQQQVSQLAAQDDRSANESRGQHVFPEGVREAHIMPTETDNGSGTPSVEDDNVQSGVPINQHLHPSIQVEEHDFARHSSLASSLEQRPTRPLDLDPQRAQIPADNMSYMRHLGFSPPSAEAMEAPVDDGGWIYLNLLINMAQLHIINVTPDFVKDSLSQYSRKFEVSHDGRRVRWKGGKSPTHNSSDGDATPLFASPAPATAAEHESQHKRATLSDGCNDAAIKRIKTNIKKLESQQRKLSYTPLFRHRNDSDDSDDSSSEDDESEYSSMPMQQGGQSSTMVGSVPVTGTTPGTTLKRKRRDLGPVIFYNNARFCTDLSGDRKTEQVMDCNLIRYDRINACPIGVAVTHSAPSSARISPLALARQLPEAMDLADNPIPADQEITFPAPSPLFTTSIKSAPSVNLEVSGIGGVYPADHFAIHVESLHTKHDDTMAPEPPRSATSSQRLHRLAKLLAQGRGHGSRSVFRKQVLSTSTRTLPPSELPPATCFMSLDESDSDTSSDDEDIGAHTFLPGSPDGGGARFTSHLPAAAPQRIEMDYLHSSSSSVAHPSDMQTSDDDEDYDNDDDDAASEGSLDLLATARALDPDAVRAREREYDAHIAERFAEEIPAGSSAATAGGGSGFASPA